MTQVKVSGQAELCMDCEGSGKQQVGMTQGQPDTRPCPSCEGRGMDIELDEESWKRITEAINEED